MKKSWKALRLDLARGRRPGGVEESIAMRQVVIESAIGMVMLARPSWSGMISGLIYSASGKYERTRGADEPDPSLLSSFLPAVKVLTCTAPSRTSIASFVAGGAGGAVARPGPSG